MAGWSLQHGVAFTWATTPVVVAMPLRPSSSRTSVALFLATAGLLGGVTACGHSPEGGEGYEQKPPAASSSPEARPAKAPGSNSKDGHKGSGSHSKGDEGGEGGEGGEG